MGIFHANDIRGLLEEVTGEVAFQSGRAIVRKTGAKTVVVGRDMRSTSSMLQAEAIRGITSMGANAINIGLTSTSIFNFAVSSLGQADAGLMVTASHNPAEYNGIKFADSTGLPISGVDILAAIKDDAVGSPVGATPEGADPRVDPTGTTREENVIPAYIDKCISSMDSKANVRGMKIAVDYGNGMGALALRPLAERLGVELTELYAEPDASFPNHEANPVKRETLADVQKLLMEGDFTFGVALDGDADRIGFLDHTGEPLRGDETLALLAADELQQHPGATIIYQPNHTWATIKAITENGGRGVLRPIGRARVVEGMRTEQARLGGEVSSHYFFADFAGLESVDFAFCRMLALVAKSGKPLAELAAPVHAFANSWEVNFKVADKAAAIARVEEKYAPLATSINRLDGARMEFGQDWWFILRASNTEPVLRLTVEATSKELMGEKLKEVSELIH